jgi:hypothetical protein
VVVALAGRGVEHLAQGKGGVAGGVGKGGHRSALPPVAREGKGLALALAAAAR